MNHPTDPDAEDDMLPEYDFSKGVRGKHYQAYKAGTNVVFLDPDVAAAFGDSTSVNEALRLLLKVAKESVPAGRPGTRMQRKSPARATKPRRRSGR